MKRYLVIAYAISSLLSFMTVANASLCKYQMGAQEVEVKSVKGSAYDVSPKDLISEKTINVEWSVVDKAIQSENETHIQLNSDVTIAGKLKEIIVDEETGMPVYVQTEGPTRLMEKGEILKNQNVENHIEGYGTGLGSVKNVEVKNGDTWDALSLPNTLSGLNEVTVKTGGLEVGQRVKMTYATGLVVEGNVVNLQYLKSGKLGVISFQDATATYGARVLFRPSFGKYDVAIAETIEAANISNDRAKLDHKFNSRKYKTDVTAIKKNALEFFENMKSRFAKQKEVDPAHPYAFAFPESKSIFPYMVAETKNRLHVYQGEHGLYWRKKERVLRSIFTVFGRKEALARQEASLKAEQELLTRLLSDIEEAGKKEAPTYEESIRYSYFFTKIMQLTENNRRAPFRMVPYELFMNANYGKALDELDLYKMGIMGFTSGRFKFSVKAQQVFNPEKMELVVMPVVGFLLASDLIATRNVPVHYATVASEFARADGFVLAPYTLYLHDIYFHAGLRESHDEAYFKAHNMSEADIKTFRVEQQKWIDEFLAELKKVPDQKMRFAIAQCAQTIIHDRGEVFAPSTFNGHERRNYYYVMKGETYVASWGQKNYRIDPSYLSILQKMDEAHAWVHNFWKKYKDSKY